MNYLTNS
jgi:SET domain-containing protein